MSVLEIVQTWELFVEILRQIQHFLRHVQDVVFFHLAFLEKATYHGGVNQVFLLELFFSIAHIIYLISSAYKSLLKCELSWASSPACSSALGGLWQWPWFATWTYRLRVDDVISLIFAHRGVPRRAWDGRGSPSPGQDRLPCTSLRWGEFRPC